MYNKHISEGLSNYLKNGKYAISCYLKAIEEQQWDAYYFLGNIYYWGEGYVKTNLKNAEYYYNEGILKNNAKCIYALGRYYFEKNDKNKAKPLLERAFEEIKLQALKGDYVSQYILGKYYDCGYIAETDLKLACFWYQKSAKKGYVEAINNLGYSYMCGEGCKTNISKAEMLLNTAAEQNHSYAQVNLAFLYLTYNKVTKENIDKVINLYQKAAQQGDPDAQHMLGKFYEIGHGVPQDHYQAVYWYKKASQKNYAAAQTDLSTAYYYGEGIENNLEKAFFWSKKAAKNGDSDAQCFLGQSYLEGDKVKRNVKKAIFWLTTAAEQNNVNAQNSLGEYYQKAGNYEKANYWLCRSDGQHKIFGKYGIQKKKIKGFRDEILKLSYKKLILQPINITGAVAYLDVLGWKTKASIDKSVINKLNYILESTKKALDLIGKGKFFCKVIGMADTIAIFLEEKSNNVLELMGEIITSLLFEGAKAGLYLRGAIAYGEYYILERSDFYFGSAINELALWYETCDWIGVILTPSANNELNVQITSNTKLKTLYIDYKNIPFKTNIKDKLSPYLSKNTYALNVYNYEEPQLFEVHILNSLEQLRKEKADTDVLYKYEQTLEYISYLKSLYYNY
ncbi:MAG: sel1 repeat family protein [Bacteroidales bacterium]|jgi:TPR repeat protein|nr:sel1 repeat family protein [Bacteroidales bacterium]